MNNQQIIRGTYQTWLYFWIDADWRYCQQMGSERIRTKLGEVKATFQTFPELSAYYTIPNNDTTIQRKSLAKKQVWYNKRKLFLERLLRP
jgi:hypothetical protein